jgi:hypothetical protein
MIGKINSTPILEILKDDTRNISENRNKKKYNIVFTNVFLKYFRSITIVNI